LEALGGLSFNASIDAEAESAAAGEGVTEPDRDSKKK